jgi:hypothetical protein
MKVPPILPPKILPPQTPLGSQTLYTNVLKKYISDLFFESGTNYGGGVQTALDAGFKNIISVETQQSWYDISYKRHGNKDGVKLILGNSVDVMYDLLSEFTGRITFWLDGHSEKSVPVLQELDIINKLSRHDHIIMVDDRRVMDKYCAWVGIKESHIIAKMKIINPAYRILYENSPMAPRDIIVATL